MLLFFAAKAIIERDGKVLLLREGSAYHDGTKLGKYDMPGGRLNPAEDVRTGLLREVAEETGLSVEPDMKPFYMGEWWPKPRGEEWHVVCNFFRCTALAGDVKLSDDHDDARWVGPQEWQALPLATHIDKVLEGCW